MQKIFHEIALFKSKPLNMRVLLLTNLIYVAVFPISNIFSSAYVMRNSGDNMTFVAVYQLASYMAIPLAFWLNGLLLNHFRIERLFSLGMFLSGASMFVMMMLPKLTITGLGFAGFLMSLSAGFYWANRDFLALSTTSDSTRSYYYGLDQFFSTNVGILTPFLIGDLFLASIDKYHWFNLNINQAYYFVLGLVFLLCLAASVMIHQGNFKNPKKTKFVYFKFHHQWKFLQILTIVRGLAQGYMSLAPALLILTLIGKEGAIGEISSAGGILSAITLYILGRTTGPQHRLIIYTVAVVAFAVGAVTNTLLYSAVGVLIFIALQTLSSPLQEISYFGTQMLLIDVTSFLEKRNEYAYIFNLEFSYLLGRCSGLIFFIVLAKNFDSTFALRYALPIVAIIQLSGIYLVKHILAKCHEEKSHDHNREMDLATLNAELAAGRTV